jgi:hypothetical protein
MQTSESARTFEGMKDDLLRSHPGQFALVCGPRLMGVYPSIDEALAAASQAFDDEEVTAGAPMLITEIAPHASVRVTATPFRRATAPGAAARL